MTSGTIPSLAARKLRGELEALCEEWLAPHSNRIASSEYQPRPKIVNDAIWGSIHLNSWEVAVLDSDLLQRLRFLRQLGVAHWLYPSAGHSRLEHSLGVLHQMQALLSAIERSSSRADAPLFGDVTAKLLRLAALVHDCGHAVMSHVSEEFIQDLPGVEDLRVEVWRRYRARKKPSVSEAFAAVFVESPSFQKMLSLPAVGADFVRDAPQACAMIAGFVVGGPVIPQSAFLSLLMSGATDADKLDYMPRDSQMAGVPTPVDVRRVIEKLRVLDVPKDLLPDDYSRWAGMDDRGSHLKVLVLTSSGARALDELAMGRRALFEKIYHHHKVRAIEVMVRRALNESSVRTAPEWLRLVDDDLIADLTRFGAIRSRILLKRALALPAPEEGDVEGGKAWVRLTGPSEGAGDRPELHVLRDKLVVEATRVAELLGGGAEALKAQPPEVDRPDAGKLTLDGWAYVGDSGEEIKKAASGRAGYRSEGGKHAARQYIHFFAPEAGVLATFIAARRLLASYGISAGSEAYRATRLDPDVIQAAERKLVDAGYLGPDEFQGLTVSARIVSHRQAALETFLRVAWPRLADLATKFGRYQAPSGDPVGPAQIARFLRQFGTEALARTGLRVLEAIDFVDRSALASALRSCIERTPEIQTVCPLGGAGDSSAFTSYLMNDIPAQSRRTVCQLELALERGGDDPILLWDDLCGLGNHTITVLCQWLGISDTIALDEDLVERMSAERIASFRRRAVTIGFAMARPSGLARLQEFLERQGLTNVSIAIPGRAIDQHNRAFESSEIISDPQARDAFREHCKNVANRLLRPKVERKERPISEREAEQRLLGYGNEAHLIVLPYNVPTITLTALWESGENWDALFPRRTKPPRVS